LKTSDFDYDLPPEFIAQTPLEPRDASRLLVLHRDNGRIEHHNFRELGDFLRPGDLLVLNETRVIPARLYARKIPTGGRVELLLLGKRDSHTWESLVGGKGLIPGKRIQLEDGLEGEVVNDLGGPRRLVRFAEPLEPVLDQIGHMPLPPYIHTPLGAPERYQTVYARHRGSAAAPTAGLHFTPALLETLTSLGVRKCFLTLHIGYETFRPVKEEKVEDHIMHSEFYSIPAETLVALEKAKQDKRRIIAVGTTVCRVLETLARTGVKSETGAAGWTDIFIYPGFEFKAVDAMVTNFHLPRSTLLMLVAAFAGTDRILAAYRNVTSGNWREPQIPSLWDGKAAQRIVKILLEKI